jgi:K+-transporting ATPase ATPase C chain
MLRDLRPAIIGVILFTLVFGLAYPLAVTALAGAVFPFQAQGSLVKGSDGRVVGSALIAQGFAKPEYLHPRLSAAGNGYDPLNSGGSNLGPLDPKLTARVKGDAVKIAKEDGGASIPADAVTTSASGLDPDVSPQNASLQAVRIAASRVVSVAQIQEVIDAHTTAPTLGFIGQSAVNVLAVNRALDERYPMAHPKG